MGGGGSEPLDYKHGQFLGPWGNLGSQTQKGIVTYSLSANRQRPFAGATSAAIFNTYRRSRAQFLYVVPPLVLGYMLIDWANEKNHYYNSKEGRMHDTEAAEEATGGGTVRA
ncbi:MAG: hypothetical protein LQ350_003213 [Teloschistes chrysophthalmus]|nr:MAG: hypothetical protein LQ350_003213 [Niorma chrysophthalma]